VYAAHSAYAEDGVWIRRVEDDGVYDRLHRSLGLPDDNLDIHQIFPIDRSCCLSCVIF